MRAEGFCCSLCYKFLPILCHQTLDPDPLSNSAIIKTKHHFYAEPDVDPDPTFHIFSVKISVADP